VRRDAEFLSVCVKAPRSRFEVLNRKSTHAAERSLLAAGVEALKTTDGGGSLAFMWG
jgi:hypothetical protein